MAGRWIVGALGVSGGMTLWESLFEAELIGFLPFGGVLTSEAWLWITAALFAAGPYSVYHRTRLALRVSEGEEENLLKAVERPSSVFVARWISEYHLSTHLQDTVELMDVAWMQPHFHHGRKWQEEADLPEVMTITDANRARFLPAAQALLEIQYSTDPETTLAVLEEWACAYREFTLLGGELLGMTCRSCWRQELSWIIRWRERHASIVGGLSDVMDAGQVPRVEAAVRRCLDFGDPWDRPQFEDGAEEHWLKRKPPPLRPFDIEGLSEKRRPRRNAPKPNPHPEPRTLVKVGKSGAS